MSLREHLPEQGFNIGGEKLVFEHENGFAIADDGCWLAGIYHTFEAAEMAFQLLEEDIDTLMSHRYPFIRGITLFEIERMLIHEEV